MFQESFFAPFINPDDSLDAKRLLEHMILSKEAREYVATLTQPETELLFKIFYDQGLLEGLSQLLKENSLKELNLRSSFVLKLVLKDNKISDLQSKELNTLIQNLDESSALELASHRNSFQNEQLTQKIEKSCFKLKTESENYKNELINQIQFLQNEKLYKKALEIKAQLHFSFPELASEKHKIQDQQSTEHSKHARVIERNLSFDLRSEARQQLKSNVVRTLEEEKKTALNLAEAWGKELSKEHLSLLLTQLEFLDLDAEDYYSNLLARRDIDQWDKLHIYMKSKRFLEGLSFLSEIEHDFLSSTPEHIYSFYYTKALFLLGAGLNTQAEEILNLILEQNENFRDVKSLLKN